MKRGAPLARRTPLKRGTGPDRSPMRRRKGSTSYARRERDFERMGAVRSMPCCVADLGGVPWPGPRPPDACSGPGEAHHAGARGLGRKASDDTVIPLCDHHHDDFTDRRGVFSSWPRGAARAWQDAQIERYRRVYEEQRAGAGAAPF